MSEVNLGRVQGGGIFYSTASSATSITKSTLTPTGLAPLVGDSVVFPNGDLRKITAVSGDNITCGSVAANFKGDKGEGVPEGGTTGQVLTKASDTDYDTEWTTPSEGTAVEANPTDESTVELEKLKVGTVVYSIPKGGSEILTATNEEIDALFTA